MVHKKSSNSQISTVFIDFLSNLSVRFTLALVRNPRPSDIDKEYRYFFIPKNSTALKIVEIVMLFQC